MSEAHIKLDKHMSTLQAQKRPESIYSSNDQKFYHRTLLRIDIALHD